MERDNESTRSDRLSIGKYGALVGGAVRYGTGGLETGENPCGDRDLLRELADQLDGDGPVRVALGGESAMLNPVDPITFELDGEPDREEGKTEAKRSVEYEPVRWRTAKTAEDVDLEQFERE